ncbi:MAG: hypothetical protein IKJ62_01490 [Alphaproteobacteria bacterium]|nr:hypothetical protein [Alphaproteobacteria bacterium]
MKRFIAVLSGLLVLPAFAEVAPLYYDEIIEYSEEESAPAEDATVAEDVTVVAPVVVQPSRANPRIGVNASGRAASRALPSNAVTNAGTRGATGRNTVAARTTAADTARTARSATANVSQRGTVSRNAARSGSANQIATTRRQMQATSKPGVAARASIVQTDTVNTPLYTGRVAMRAGAARARISSVSSLGSGTTSSEQTVEDTTASMDELAQMTDFCKAQYTQCMDNFCNVLDDNQGRCSCSKNLKNYAKTEDALKKATEDLQDVAQQIQYIGLTSDEINTLFSQTEAEQTMQSKTDNTQLKNSLDSIRRLIVDVKSGTATSADTGLNFDMSGLLDFSVDSAGFDLASLFGNQTETTSISNQRGEQLYKTAAARCKASVLTSCQSQGVDISVITNGYDLEIDKQCLIYERNLTDANDEMVQTVRNAKGVLQRARLMVAQQKNAYDLRGCINALDSCMQDDFVCGSDYENCLDPTGKYIVNGEIVVGSTPGYTVASATTADKEKTTYSKDTLYGTWVYDDGEKYAWGATITEGNLGDYIESTVSSTAQQTNSSLMSEYLLYKIGYNSGGKNYGMCISVLNKCQDYTYENGTYEPDNVVVKQYLDRTMTQIKAQQDAVIASHAEKCITDVTSCLSTNGYEGQSDTASPKDQVALNACRAQISTCMSVNGAANSGVTDIKAWAKSIYNTVQ